MNNNSTGDFWDPSYDTAGNRMWRTYPPYPPYPYRPWRPWVEPPFVPYIPPVVIPPVVIQPPVVIRPRAPVRKRTPTKQRAPVRRHNMKKATGKKETFITLVLDRSASMGSCRESALDSINEQIGSIKKHGKKGGKTFVSLILFDDTINWVGALLYVTQC